MTSTCNMKAILSCAIIWIVASMIVDVTASVAQVFEDHEIVPDAIPRAPLSLAEVVFPSGVEVKLGNELTPTQVRDIPTVTWENSADQLYTLIMIDLDAPSRAEPTYREVQHWLVGNIKGGDVAGGELVNSFVGSGPPVDTGLHRYVFLVYEQPGFVVFDEPRGEDGFLISRTSFSTINFVTKYNLGDPIAGNFYQAQFKL